KVDTRSERPQVVVDRAEAWVRPNGEPPPRREKDTLVANGRTSQTNNANGGNSKGNSNVDGDDSAATPNAATPHESTPDESTPAAANSDDPTLNGSTSKSNGNHADTSAFERRVLRVVVPRNGDDNACVHLLEQLHALIQRCPGPD